MAPTRKSESVNKQYLSIYEVFPDKTPTGVSTDIWTCYAARIMAISVIPFLTVQLPQVLNSTSGRHLAVLIALIVSISMLVSYCVYQVFQPSDPEKTTCFREAQACHIEMYCLGRLLTDDALSDNFKALKMHCLGRLLTDDGEPNIEIIRK
ncbi:hypothetical protein F3Y22_tig00110943pilonHSYRG00011 [Hibiscus syriacus]|uniref:Uncharacterized protein n=1 Tax=Hibiscus syriacus TaxID=106335 RepID=A0A6A2ZBZ6_HIBSY|nr:hypothetical protein F3Y22_tig00110943pilonHSYRG00011 [Hibiscus syriacus]